MNMKLIDFIFNICYAPFQKVDNGRFAALIWLVPTLTFISVGLINMFLYYLHPFISINTTPIGIGIGCFLIGAIIFLYLDKIYVKNKRDTGKARFPVFCAFLILIMIVGSLVFFSMSLYKFRWS